MQKKKKARLDYIYTPPIVDEEKSLLGDKYLPLLVECTNYRELRPAMYNQKVIHRIAYKMEEHIQSVDIVISGSNLLFCIMFKFGDPVDIKFLRQYLNCKGPDLTIEVTKYYTEVWKMSERSIIAVFLPMIGLAVIPEGRTWIKKHYLSVSEYINFFKKENLKQYIAPNPEFTWCLTKAHFGKIYKVWNYFYDVVTEIQTEQRERNMNQLLEEEEREKERQIKKKQKKKQKKQDKISKGFETNICDPEDSSLKQNIAVSLECGKSCSNEKPEKVEEVQKEIFLHKDGKCSSKITNMYLVEPELSTFCDQWKTVQAKKNINREKAKLSNKTSLVKANSNVADTPTDKKGKRGSKLEHTPHKTRIQSLNCKSKTRWADIAKVKPRVAESKTDNHIKILKRDISDQPKPVQFVAADFPCLLSDAQVKRTKHKEKNEKPGVVTFYFHEECNALKGGVLQKSLERNKDGKGMFENSTNSLVEHSNKQSSFAMEDSVNNPTPSEWTWESVAEIGEYSHGNFAEAFSQSNSLLPTIDQMEKSSYLLDNFQSGDAFKDTIPRQPTQIRVENNPNSITYKPSNPVSNVLDTHAVFQEETLCNCDISKREDKGPHGAEGFCNKVDSENSTTLLQNNLEFNIESDNVNTDGSGAQDLFHIDPAIIGCGVLHRPSIQTVSTSCSSKGYKPLQKSRFLGNVITNHPRNVQINEDGSTCRAHKGWSNKRRMKTKHEDSLPLSTKHWSLGESLLENVRQLEKEMAIEGICYPDSLSCDKKKEETHFFPSFHGETRLSGQVDPSMFSLIHRIQLIQLAERQDYIEKSIRSTYDETLFAYYASCAGLSRLQYYQLIEHRCKSNRPRNNSLIEAFLHVQQVERGHEVNLEKTNPARKHVSVTVRGTCQSKLASGDRYDTVRLETAAVNLYNFQSSSMGCKLLQEEPEAIVVDPESVGISVPVQEPITPEVPGNQANIYAIQSAQSTMRMKVVKQIQDIFGDILRDKIKSVRWRDYLWKMRNISVEKQMIVSKMVIPADESDRLYISVTR